MQVGRLDVVLLERSCALISRDAEKVAAFVAATFDVAIVLEFRGPGRGAEPAKVC
jgi:hypothetical protein